MMDSLINLMEESSIYMYRYRYIKYILHIYNHKYRIIQVKYLIILYVNCISIKLEKNTGFSVKFEFKTQRNNF